MYNQEHEDSLSDFDDYDYDDFETSSESSSDGADICAFDSIVFDRRWNRRELKQERWKTKNERRKRRLKSELLAYDLERSLRTGIDCGENVAKYKDILNQFESCLDGQTFEYLIAINDKNLLEEYQKFQLTPQQFSWNDVMNWARSAKQQTDIKSMYIRDFISFLYAKLSFINLNMDSRKHQYLLAVRINHFTMTEPLIGYQNECFKNVDPSFRRQYKSGKIKLKDGRKYRHNTKVHTELQLLHGEQGNKFVATAIENDDLLLIYSHYIPCQDNVASVNDCASDMALYFTAKKAHTEPAPAVIVAYEEVYPGTDSQNSEAMLKQGNITLLALSSECYALKCVCHN